MSSKNEEYKVRLRKCKKTDSIKSETWKSSNGFIYCPHGPAMKQWDTNGRLTDEIWHNCFGFRHRKDGPATIHRDYEDGTVSEMYFLNGRLDRSGQDLPSATVKTEDGTVIDEWFYSQGKLHRDNQKPAMIRRHHKTGVAYHESVWEMGHCISVIERDKKSGAVTYTGPPTENHQNEFISDGYSI
tara:strand:- start:1264 stop:1818 length:555 start_codon:yes stop_codon:yes gene_type:complete